MVAAANWEKGADASLAPDTEIDTAPILMEKSNRCNVDVKYVEQIVRKYYKKRYGLKDVILEYHDELEQEPCKKWYFEPYNSEWSLRLAWGVTCEWKEKC